MIDFGKSLNEPLEVFPEETSWVSGVVVMVGMAARMGAVLVVVAVVGYTLFLRRANRTSARPCDTPAKMHGKTVLVTTNGTGVGVEVARDLAGRGAKVLITCPFLQEARLTAASIVTSTGNRQVKGLQLDTSSLASVRSLASTVTKYEERLDVLVLAAGCGASPSKSVTTEGLEVTMATNYFGHFLLVNLLIGLLRKSRPSRVVVLAASAHHLLSSINPKDINFEGVQYGGVAAYAQAQLCNLLMANNLAHLTAGTGVVVNSACPGLVWTEPYLQGRGLLCLLFTALLCCVSRTPAEGAQSLLHAAVDPKAGVLTGAFFTNCSETQASGLALNSGLAKKVWEKSEGLVHLLPPPHTE